MHWLDSQEYDKVVDCYAEMGSHDQELHHAQAQKRNRLLIKTHGKKLGLDANFVGQPIISIDGDHATGYWNVLVLFSEPVHWVQGINECEYVQENDNWKFRKLKFTRIKAAPPATAHWNSDPVHLRGALRS